MKQRGRVSAAALSMIGAGGEQARPSPPPGLSDSEREMFANIVAGCDANHFRSTDLPLLSRYCEAAILAEQAALELWCRCGRQTQPVDCCSGKMRPGYGVFKHAAAFVSAEPHRWKNFG